MFLIFELWREKDPWRNLAAEERRERFARIGLEHLESKGVKLQSVAKLGPEAAHQLGGQWNYAATWSAPTMELVEDVINRSKVHKWLAEFFDTMVVFGTSAGHTLKEFQVALSLVPSTDRPRSGLTSRMGHLEEHMTKMDERFEKLESMISRLSGLSTHQGVTPPRDPGHHPGPEVSAGKWPGE